MVLPGDESGRLFALYYLHNIYIIVITVLPDVVPQPLCTFPAMKRQLVLRRSMSSLFCIFVFEFIYHHRAPTKKSSSKKSSRYVLSSAEEEDEASGGEQPAEEDDEYQSDTRRVTRSSRVREP